jgi:hypothetical protein
LQRCDLRHELANVGCLSSASADLLGIQRELY